jgi:hypothetical protein
MYAPDLTLANAKRLFCLLAAVAAITPIAPASAGERTTVPKVSYTSSPITASSIGALTGNANSAAEADFNECKEHHGGLPPHHYVCCKTLANGSIQAYGTNVTNGQPNQYTVSGESYCETTTYEGVTTTDSDPLSLVMLITVQHTCPSGFGGQSSGPATNRTVVCSKTETHSCPASGNPINIASLCKFEHEIDYATVDGVLTVERRYIDQRSGWSFDAAPRLLEVPAGTSVASDGIYVGNPYLSCPDNVSSKWKRYKAHKMNLSFWKTT